MKENRKSKLVLENGQQWHGLALGAATPVVGEIVFNTSMVGYTEIISDPAMAGQIVVMTYPLMGQYGITDEDMESRVQGLAGLIVRENCDTPSNFRYTKTLEETLEERGVVAMSGPDTRMITSVIRDKGNMKAAIVDEDTSLEEALELIKNTPAKENPVAEVSCSKRKFSRTPLHKFDVAILDCGVKQSVIKALTRRGCNVTVLPYNSTAEEIMAFNPDGLLISGGPGSPEAVSSIVGVINELKGELPVFGMGLGHQLICMSYGAKVYKLECGQYGDAPVRNCQSGRIVTAMHTHSYAVCRESLESTPLEVTYENVLDAVVEGVRCPSDKVCSVQFAPEGGPGPEETDFFDLFVESMQK